MHRGITHCSKPRNLYWFDPVQIILSELLAGATIALPSKVNTILTLIRIVSKLMFGFFMLSICMNFVCIFLGPLVLYAKWHSYHLVTLSFISSLVCTAGTVTATVMYAIFQRVISSQKELNITATLGARMFAFMWIATAFSAAGWIIHLCVACGSRREEKAENSHETVKSQRSEVIEQKTGIRQRVRLPRLWKNRVVGESI